MSTPVATFGATIFAASTFGGDVDDLFIEAGSGLIGRVEFPTVGRTRRTQLPTPSGRISFSSIGRTRQTEG